MGEGANVALVVVVLIGLAFMYYRYEYATTCPLAGGTPVAGQPGYCQRAGSPSIGSNSVGKWIPNSGATKASVGECAAHCAAAPGCNVFQWNPNNKACALATYPTGAGADSGVIPDANYVSGAKVVSRAQPW